MFTVFFCSEFVGHCLNINEQFKKQLVISGAEHYQHWY